VGGLGDDTYQYAFKGTDIVSDSGGLNDTLYVTSRDKNDVVLLGDSYVENGNLILVSKQDSSKSLTVENAFSADGRIENAVFHTDSGAWEDETYRISSIEDNFAGDDLLYFGTQSNDRLFMNDGYNEAIVSAGHDTVKIGDGGGWVSSGDGNDTVRGNIGKDTIFTEDGDDKAYGSIGADTIDTGNGNDLIRAGHGLDQAFGGSGADTIKGGHGNDVLFGGDGEDLIKGGHGSDTLYGEADDDRLLGGHGNDVLSGGDGNDFLKGAWGADEYIGGAGADVMHSKHDEKVDTFTFLNVSDSSVGSSRDIIKSFETGIDKVDLSAIDASTLEGHQSLVYSGSEATANSVWSVISGSSRLLRADVTGDTQHDFEVQFERLDSFSQDDFILSEIL
jgi:Ca2+-binding RTX toxin-like protein